MPLSPPEVEQLDDGAKKLLELWMNIKLAFIAAFGSREITREHETMYLNLKSDVSRIYRVMSEKLPKGLLFEGEKMIEMLKNAMTLEAMRGFPASERQNYYKMWHNIYIRLTRTLGALDVMKAGYYPHLHRDLLKTKKKDVGTKKRPGKI
jgi:hypothetical protein